MANYCNNIDYVHLNKRKKKVLNGFPLPENHKFSK